MRLLWLLIGWLSLFLTSSMARTKKTLQMGEGKGALQVRMRAEVWEEAWEPPAWVDPLAPEMEQAPTQEELAQQVREAERLWGH